MAAALVTSGAATHNSPLVLVRRTLPHVRNVVPVLQKLLMDATHISCMGRHADHAVTFVSNEPHRVDENGTRVHHSSSSRSGSGDLDEDLFGAMDIDESSYLHSIPVQLPPTS